MSVTVDPMLKERLVACAAREQRSVSFLVEAFCEAGLTGREPMRKVEEQPVQITSRFLREQTIGLSTTNPLTRCGHEDCGSQRCRFEVDDPVLVTDPEFSQ